MSIKDTAARKTAATAESIDPRTRKALEQYLTVTPDVGRARGAEDLVLVTSESGSSYLVDVREDSCECPDAEYRDIECKHVKRARFSLALDAIPADAAAACDVDPDLGQHCDADLRFAAADGGIIVADDDGEILDEDDDEPDQQRLDEAVDLSEEYGEAPLAGTCIAGYERCCGISGMYFGEFPCAHCWLYAPASAHVHFHDVGGADE
ncbi:hypothetical protein NDI54_05830 [Haloarcula sp. S1AR25-5A]|uniref:SWIM-type domain-containing protein n=1 Tax=Haloarcula terrestris TaxID=2950533 RepID=A0AAE4EY66_9EURY|nr:hypothetical protein [Haloarcula terrestris]MDS0220873.1 hypothetical protein [Haloarcula terrestris]